MTQSTERTAMSMLELILNCTLDMNQIVYVDFEERVLSIDDNEDIIAEAMLLEDFLAAVVTYHRFQGNYQELVPVFYAVDDGMAAW